MTKPLSLENWISSINEPDSVDRPQQRQEGESYVEVFLAQGQLFVGAHLRAGEIHGDDDGQVVVKAVPAVSSTLALCLYGFAFLKR